MFVNILCFTHLMDTIDFLAVVLTYVVIIMKNIKGIVNFITKTYKLK